MGGDQSVACLSHAFSKLEGLVIEGSQRHVGLGPNIKAGLRVALGLLTGLGLVIGSAVDDLMLSITLQSGLVPWLSLRVRKGPRLGGRLAMGILVDLGSNLWLGWRWGQRFLLAAARIILLHVSQGLEPGGRG